MSVVAQQALEDRRAEMRTFESCGREVTRAVERNPQTELHLPVDQVLTVLAPTRGRYRHLSTNVEIIFATVFPVPGGGNDDLALDQAEQRKADATRNQWTWTQRGGHSCRSLRNRGAQEPYRVATFGGTACQEASNTWRPTQTSMQFAPRGQLCLRETFLLRGPALTRVLTSADTPRTLRLGSHVACAVLSCVILSSTVISPAAFSFSFSCWPLSRFASLVSHFRIRVSTSGRLPIVHLLASRCILL